MGQLPFIGMTFLFISVISQISKNNNIQFPEQINSNNMDYWSDIVMQNLQDNASFVQGTACWLIIIFHHR